MPVEPQVFDLLVYLIANRDRVVTKDELLQNIWKSRSVSESALTTRINAVRRAVGDSGDSQRLIRTLPRRGFRFVGEVRCPIFAIARSSASAGAARQAVGRRVVVHQHDRRSRQRIFR